MIYSLPFNASQAMIIIAYDPQLYAKKQKLNFTETTHHSLSSTTVAYRLSAAGYRPDTHEGPGDGPYISGSGPPQSLTRGLLFCALRAPSPARAVPHRTVPHRIIYSVPALSQGDNTSGADLLRPSPRHREVTHPQPSPD